MGHRRDGGGFEVLVWDWQLIVICRHGQIPKGTNKGHIRTVETALWLQPRRASCQEDWCLVGTTRLSGASALKLPQCPWGNTHTQHPVLWTCHHQHTASGGPAGTSVGPKRAPTHHRRGRRQAPPSAITHWWCAPMLVALGVLPYGVVVWRCAISLLFVL